MEHFAGNVELAAELNSDFVKAVLPVTVFVGIEACIGFIGNSLVLYVFSFKYHKCNFKYFVLFLALIDLTSCLTTIPGEMVTQSFWYIYPVSEICKVKSFFNIFTVCASALCLLLIAIDRYRKVCKPFGRQIKPEMAILFSVCALVIAGIVASPVPFYWGVQHYNVTHNKLTANVTSCEIDDKFKNEDNPLIYSSVTEAIISIPLVIMAVLYSFIACKIWRGIHKTHAVESVTADILENSDSMTNTLEKDYVVISKAGQLNEDGTIDETNEGNDPYRIITAIDDKVEVLTDSPGERSDEIRPNCESLNTEIENGIDRNDRCTTNLESVHFTKPKSNYVERKSEHEETKETKENHNANIVSTAYVSLHVKSSDDKRKSSSRRLTHHIKRTTLIMFILSVVFVISTVLYLTLLSLIAREDNILKTLTPKETAVYFFFFRLYFLHHVINPFVYFFLDSHFKKALMETVQTIKNRFLTIKMRR
ncbi:hypothetical protein ACJMK2_006322 [Sinanodonta woodiana]|uniref:G-protein coupled receptors family 1 profile domain-containing protein n=1 Tax=Sinanodonta woodiana TaxID=1069815 RepID=A0ABD3VVW9_SINWO